MTNDEAQLTRRTLATGIFYTPVVLRTFIGQDPSTPDAKLAALGRQFEQLTQTWDRLAERTHNTYDNVDIVGLIRALDPIEASIIARRAKTIEGLLVKARAANWSRGGRIYPEQEVSTDKKMAWSIVRDLLEMSGDIRKPFAQAFCEHPISEVTKDSPLLAGQQIDRRSTWDASRTNPTNPKMPQPADSRGAGE